MPKLGIVTCQILELEFAHILLNDPAVKEIWVTADEFSEELIQILENDGKKSVYRIVLPEAFDPDTIQGFSVLVHVIKTGLHNNIANLRNEIKKTVMKLAPFVDAVFLGYGLCGNALKNPKDLFKDIPVPVSLPMEGETLVDDCVGLIIGGRKNYYAEQCRCAGTMFMNAGFSRHMDSFLALDIPEKLSHKKEKIIHLYLKSYERSLFLTTPVMGEDELRKNTMAFNKKYNLRTETRKGTLALLENAWKTAKNNSCRGNQCR